MSVTNITSIVSNIQNESSTVATSLQTGYKEVNEGTSQIIRTGETFNGINVAVIEMVDQINMIANYISEILVSSHEMHGSIETIAAVSEEAAAGVEETTASTQQSSAIMEEVLGSSKQLSQVAEKLNSLVNQFKL